MDETGWIIRILIADDHPIFRDGLRNLLDAQPGFQVVGEARDGQEALSLTEQLKPDILLLDMAMPRFSGIEVMRAIAARGISVRTVLLSAALKESEVAEAFELGARALVSKESPTSLLFKCINCVMAGQYWIGHSTVSSLIQSLNRIRESAKKEVRPKNYGLTSKEIKVLAAVVSGYTNKEIASQFSISEQTVKHHLTNIFDKVGVYNRLELALFAIHHGLMNGVESPV